MSLFAIADLHLSFGTDKKMDVFTGWSNYTQRLEKNWRSVVTDDDTVVIAGDVSWAMKLEDTKKDFEFINSLPGKKIIIKGNHDYWWSTKRKMENYLHENGFNTISILYNTAYSVDKFAICGTRGWFYDAESDDDKKVLNREIGRLNASIDVAAKLGGEIIAFLHYPPVYGCAECKEIIDTLILRNITRCYYGHVHGSEAIKRAYIGEYKGISFNLISCDYTNFIPVLIK